MTSSSSRKGLLTSRLTQAPSKYSRVRAKVKFVRWLPKRVAGFAPIPHRIYINRRNYDEFDSLNISFLRLLFHEVWHQVQIERVGWWEWVWKYLTSPVYRMMWEAESHVFGDIQMYVEYPYERMMAWAEDGIRSYFRGGRVPISAEELEEVLNTLWDQMKEISVVLEYEL